MMLKRCFLTLCVFAALGLSACGGDSDNGGENNGGGGENNGGGGNNGQCENGEVGENGECEGSGEHGGGGNNGQCENGEVDENGECGGSGEHGGGGEEKPKTYPDDDGDTIGDYWEHYDRWYGEVEFVDLNHDDIPDPYLDTDEDGHADYQDTDSDGDTLPDRIEGWTNGDTTREPIAGANSFGEYCFRIEDCDGNEIPDAMDCKRGVDYSANGVAAPETCEDTNADGVPDFADDDDDGDGVKDRVEIVGVMVAGHAGMDCDGDTVPDEYGSVDEPLDCDHDGTPDYKDSDSDGDTIEDKFEGIGDADGDGIANRYDQDSDEDSILDRDERGTGERPADSDGDGVFDFLDFDSDDDGVPDHDEVVCENLGGKLSRLYVDTDEDGSDDLVEYVLAMELIAKGDASVTSAADLICNPDRKAKDLVEFYFKLPTKDSVEQNDTLTFKPLITKADLLLNFDHTGSMADMIDRLRETFVSVVVGAVRESVPDSQFGVSIFGDTDASPLWQLLQGITDNLTLVANALAKVEAKLATTQPPEAIYEALYRAADGVSFRTGALPIIINITDAEGRTTNGIDQNAAINHLSDKGIRVMSLYNTKYAEGVVADVISTAKNLARGTNARVPVCAFKTSETEWLCAPNKCCTTYDINDNNRLGSGGLSTFGEDPDSDGYCPMAFETKSFRNDIQSKLNGNQQIVEQARLGVEALVKYSTYTVSTRVIGEPIPTADQASAGVDTSCFIKRIEAVSYDPPSQEPEKTCVLSVNPEPFDNGNVGYDNAFRNFAVGAATPDSPTATLTFNVVAQNDNCVSMAKKARSYSATIEVYDPVTGLVFDHQRVAIIVPSETEDVIY